MNKTKVYVAERGAKDNPGTERLAHLRHLLDDKGYSRSYVLGHDPKEDSMGAHSDAEVILVDARGLEEEIQDGMIVLLVNIAVVWKKQIMLYDSVEDEEAFTDFSIDFDKLKIPKEQRVIYTNFETAVSHVSLRVNRSKKSKGVIGV